MRDSDVNHFTYITRSDPSCPRLVTSVQGSPGTLRIVLDGRLTVLRRLSDNALFTTLPLPVTGGTNERATGIEFESDKRGLLAGQRVDNYIVSDAAAVLPCSGACDDGNPCTTNDTCSAGDCSGTPVDCGADDDACNLGMCDASTGACTTIPKPNNTACDDGLAGTTGDTCTCGTCVGTCTIDANCDDGSECNGLETCVGGRCVAGTPDVDACVDHFFCYSARAAKADKSAPAYPAFVPVEGLTFTDAFGGVAPDQHKLDLKKTLRLCAPADKNGEDPTAPAHTQHLLAYKVGITKTDPKQPKPAKVVKRIDNQLGELRLLVSGNDSVLVPSNKALGDAGAPSLVSPSVDHFRCYKAKVAKAPRGEPAYPEFTPVTVTVSDQFGGPKHYDLLKPTLLCNPANKEGEDPTAPSHFGHLVCYKAKLSKLDPPQTPFASLRVSTNNQLGQEVLDVKKVDRLCIPSLRID